MKISLVHALRIIDCGTFFPVTDAVVYVCATETHTSIIQAVKKDGGFYIFTSPLIIENDSIEIVYKGHKYVSVFDEKIKTIYINKTNLKYPVLILSGNVPKGACDIPCCVDGFAGDIVIDGLHCGVKEQTYTINTFKDGVLTLEEPLVSDLNAYDEITVKE